MSGTESSLQGADALLSFTVENTLSYRDETTLSLAATRPAEEDARRDLALAGRKYPVGVLPAVGLFGANASGKSAILKAMADMREAVLGSFRNRSIIGSIYQPFALDPRSREKPSSYEVDLIINDVRWQYGFEINEHQVLKEYAYYFPKGRQSLIFSRDKGGVDFGATVRPKDVRVIRKFSNINGLLLSTSEATIINTIIFPLFYWFTSNFLFAISQNLDHRVLQTASLLHDKDFRDRILSLIRLADIGITDIKTTEPDSVDAERLMKATHILEGGEESGIGETILLEDIRLEHLGIEIEPDYESTGTMTWIGLIGPAIEVLERGSLLLVDELDASLHPDLVAVLINLFQDTNTNPHCAQIIFNAQDMTILNRHHSRLERDQIWFTEKDSEGVTTLYSLAESRNLKSEPPKGEAPYISYLKDRYGALPILDLDE